MKTKITNKLVVTMKLVLTIFMVIGGLQLATVSNNSKVHAATTKADMMLWNNAKNQLNPPVYSTDQTWNGNKVYWAGSKSRILNTIESDFGQTNAVLIQGEESLGDINYNNTIDGNGYLGSVLSNFIDAKAISALSQKENDATLVSARNETGYVVNGAGGIC